VRLEPSTLHSAVLHAAMALLGTHCNERLKDKNIIN